MGIRSSQADASQSERDPRSDLSGRGSADTYAPKPPGFAAAYRNFTEEIDLSTLALDPSELFGSIRKEAQGRDVRL